MTDYRQAVVDFARGAEREELEHGYLVLARRQEEAHQAIDRLEPCPPRLTDDGKDYTPGGRLEWWREHANQVWVRSQSVEDKLYEVPGRAGVEVIEWLERERRPL